MSNKFKTFVMIGGEQDKKKVETMIKSGVFKQEPKTVKYNGKVVRRDNAYHAAKLVKGGKLTVKVGHLTAVKSQLKDAGVTLV